jgi:hypothetical protein
MDELKHGVTAKEIAEWEGISENFAEKVLGVIMHYQETEDENWNSISFDCTNIYWLDGEKTSHYLEKKLWWTLDDLRKLCDAPTFYSDTDKVPSGTMFIQEEDKGGYIDFLNLDRIALIEVPAIKYWQIACEDSPDLLDRRELSPYMPHKNSERELSIEQKL